jgi:hypothetical protein
MPSIAKTYSRNNRDFIDQASTLIADGSFGRGSVASLALR